MSAEATTPAPAEEKRWARPNEVWVWQGRYYLVDGSGRSTLIMQGREVIAVMFGLIGAALTAGLLAIGNHIDAPTPYAVQELLPAQRASVEPLVLTTAPIEVKLRIVSQAQFDHEKKTKDTMAFMRPGTTPCEITVPAGWHIMLTPARGSARFTDGQGRLDDIPGLLLAHEIAHCYVGAWHPE